jgi:hypothetical protein
MQSNGKNQKFKLENRGAKNLQSLARANAAQRRPRALVLRRHAARGPSLQWRLHREIVQRRNAASPLFATMDSSCTITDDT